MKLRKNFTDEGILKIKISEGNNQMVAVVFYEDKTFFKAPLTRSSTPQDDVISSEELEDYLIVEVKSKNKQAYLDITYIGD